MLVCCNWQTHLNHKLKRTFFLYFSYNNRIDWLSLKSAVNTIVYENIGKTEIYNWPAKGPINVTSWVTWYVFDKAKQLKSKWFDSTRELDQSWRTCTGLL